MESKHRQDARESDSDARIGNLISDLMREDFAARTGAVRDLVSLGRAASSALVRALGADSIDLRWQAALALRRIADPASVPALLDALEDSDIGVRWLAAEALAAIGTPALAPLLEQLIRRADSVLFREGAKHVLLGNVEGPLGRTPRPVLDALAHSAAEISTPVASNRALRELKRRGIDVQSSSASSS